MHLGVCVVNGQKWYVSKDDLYPFHPDYAQLYYDGKKIYMVKKMLNALPVLEEIKKVCQELI